MRIQPESENVYKYVQMVALLITLIKLVYMMMLMAILLVQEIILVILSPNNVYFCVLSALMPTLSQKNVFSSVQGHNLLKIRPEHARLHAQTNILPLIKIQTIRNVSSFALKATMHRMQHINAKQDVLTF